MRTHQPDEDVFESVLAENIDWEPLAAFPPSARRKAGLAPLRSHH
jgi:hypothetical protein